MVAVWVILFGIFIVFIPFNKKSQRRPTSVYLGFVIALAFEMFGIPLSMYVVTWVIGVNLPQGILWQPHSPAIHWILGNVHRAWAEHDWRPPSNSGMASH